MTDTGKWDKAWFQNLPASYKLFWFYILDRCDLAGVWDVNLKAASFFIGAKITMEGVNRYINGQIYEINERYWLITDFIRFQNGWPLNEKSPVHKKIIELLDLRGIAIKDNTLYDTLLDRVCHTQIVIVKVKVGEKVKVDSAICKEEFEIFWKEYPKKKNKDKAFEYWQKKENKPPIVEILAKLQLQIKSDDWIRDSGKWIPYPGSYINAGGWHDEIKSKRLVVKL